MTTQSNDIDIKSAETNFFRSLGDGKKAVVYLAQMVHHALAHGGDTTRLANLMNRIVREKSDQNAVRAINTTVHAVWNGAKTIKNKDEGTYTFKVKGSVIDNKAVDRMDDCVARGLTLRDTYIKEMKGDVASKVREPSAVAKQVIKLAKNNDMQKEDLIKLVESMWSDVTV